MVLELSTSQGGILDSTLPFFEGGDPFCWYHKFNQNFFIHKVHPNDMVPIASFFLEGEARKWFREAKGSDWWNWFEFGDELQIRFRTPLEDTTQESLKVLEMVETMEATPQESLKVLEIVETQESLKVLEVDEALKIQEPNGKLEVVACNGGVVNFQEAPKVHGPNFEKENATLQAIQWLVTLRNQGPYLKPRWNPLGSTLKHGQLK